MKSNHRQFIKTVSAAGVALGFPMIRLSDWIATTTPNDRLADVDGYARNYHSVS